MVKLELTPKTKKIVTVVVVLGILGLIIGLSVKASSENYFDLAGTTVTDKTTLQDTKYYRKGTLKAGITSTQAAAMNGGATCTEFPQTVYVPVTNATCNIFPGTRGDFVDSRNINAYQAITESQANCNYEQNTKSLTKLAGSTTADRTSFNNAVTITASPDGGLDCYAQYYNALPATQNFSCSSNIDAICSFNDNNTYQFADGSSFTAESRDKCPNDQKTVQLRSSTSISASTASGGATINAPINSGKTCGAQVLANPTSYPSTKTVPCTSPIAAVCSPLSSNSEANYTIDATDANVKLGSSLKTEPFRFGGDACDRERFNCGLERFRREMFLY